MNAARQAILGLGSNLGDRAQLLASARRALASLPGTRLLGASPVYETEPVGYADQPLFLNQVAAVETTLAPQELLRACLQIEREHGRERDIPNGPRTLDIDLLFYADVCLDEPGLVLPHPRWRERAFVVAPLADLLADGVLAGEPHWDGLRREVCGLPRSEGVTRRDDIGD